MTEKFYLTTPIYYVNSQPHIGHAYTTLAMDVLTRYQRSQGKEVFFLTGTDEHGAKIFQAALNKGKNPKAFCDEISTLFQQAWKGLDIDYSYFIRTTDKNHESGVFDFLNVLRNKGENILYEDEYVGKYCVGCEKFVTDKELVNNQCPDHKCDPELVSEKNWFFNLKKFLPQVERLIKEDKILVSPGSAKKEALGIFAQGLENISISRKNVPWGIKLPWDESQTVYVWVDALLNYWTAVQRGGKNIFWPPDLHLIGKDILKFHCIYWPALLLAYGLKDEDLPKKIFVHGYFTVNGQKMSKTIGNVIDPNDLIKKYGVDATRYLLLSQFPFGNDGDISLKRLDEKYNTDLASGLGNLVARVLTLAEKLKVVVPQQATRQDIILKLQEIKNKSAEAIAILDFYGALSGIWDLLSYCDKLIDTEKPWENRANSQLIIGDLLFAIRDIAELLQPFMPETSERIRQQLKEGKPVSLFPRLS